MEISKVSELLISSNAPVISHLPGALGGKIKKNLRYLEVNTCF